MYDQLRKKGAPKYEEDLVNKKYVDDKFNAIPQPENVLHTDIDEVISSKKTFEVLPESSVAPTEANQLINKGYADTKISSENNTVKGVKIINGTTEDCILLTTLSDGFYILSGIVKSKSAVSSTLYTFDNPTLCRVYTISPWTYCNFDMSNIQAYIVASNAGDEIYEEYYDLEHPVWGQLIGSISDQIDLKNAIDQARKGLASNSYDFYVDGDANTFYPVYIVSSAKFGFNRYSITRAYNWDAPDTWYSPTHKGGLTFTFEWAGDSYWGGNDQSYRIIEFNEVYTNMVAGIGKPVGGIIIWLRGGHAKYQLQCEDGPFPTIDIKYSSYTDAAGQVFAPRTGNGGVTTELYPKYPIRGDGSDLYIANLPLSNRTPKVDISATEPTGTKKYGDIWAT